MAQREPLPLGPLCGALIALIASAGWVAALVPAPEGEATPWCDAILARQAGERIPPFFAVTFAIVVWVLGALFGGSPWLPLSIVLALLCLSPVALRRPGWAVMIVIGLMYLPLFGTTSLWDPWETHYGEVAREILARNDWISLWWAQDKWFWSKPVLLFWMEALSMGALGIDFMPDAHPAHPEWAVRLPTVLLALAALVAIYATVRRQFGPRAGALAALVTATMPQFFFISHQAITDLPLVAGITMAVCCLLIAIQEDPGRRARVFQVGPWKVSLQHLVLFAIVMWLVMGWAVYRFTKRFI